MRGRNDTITKTDFLCSKCLKEYAVNPEENSEISRNGEKYQTGGNTSLHRYMLDRESRFCIDGSILEESEQFMEGFDRHEQVGRHKDKKYQTLGKNSYYHAEPGHGSRICKDGSIPDCSEQFLNIFNRHEQVGRHKDEKYQTLGKNSYYDVEPGRGNCICKDGSIPDCSEEFLEGFDRYVPLNQRKYSQITQDGYSRSCKTVPTRFDLPLDRIVPVSSTRNSKIKSPAYNVQEISCDFESTEKPTVRGNRDTAGISSYTKSDGTRRNQRSTETSAENKQNSSSFSSIQSQLPSKPKKVKFEAVSTLPDDEFSLRKEEKLFKCHERSHKILERLKDCSLDDIKNSRIIVEQQISNIKDEWPVLFDAKLLNRIYVHVDLDSFFASCEILKNPEYKDIPVGIGSNLMLANSNYKAREFGVKSGMPGYLAKRLCPQLVIIPANYPRYNYYSDLVMNILSHFDGDVEIYGIDEACLVFDAEKLARAFDVWESHVIFGRWNEPKMRCVVNSEPQKVPNFVENVFVTNRQIHNQKTNKSRIQEAACPVKFPHARENHTKYQHSDITAPNQRLLTGDNRSKDLNSICAGENHRIQEEYMPQDVPKTDDHSISEENFPPAIFRTRSAPLKEPSRIFYQQGTCEMLRISQVDPLTGYTGNSERASSAYLDISADPSHTDFQSRNTNSGKVDHFSGIAGRNQIRTPNSQKPDIRTAERPRISNKFHKKPIQHFEEPQNIVNGSKKQSKQIGSGKISNSENDFLFDGHLNYKNVEFIVNKIREAVHRTTGLTISAGISVCRGLSKFASNIKKPNGQFTIRKDFQNFLSNLDVDEINGIGKYTKEMLEKTLNIKKIREIQEKAHLLNLILKEKTFTHLLRLSFGLSVFDRPEILQDLQTVKSKAKEISFAPTDQFQDLLTVLWDTSVKLEASLLKGGYYAQVITLRIRKTNFKSRTIQQKLFSPIQSQKELFDASHDLFCDFFCEGKRDEPVYKTFSTDCKINLLGVRVSHLINQNQFQSIKAFEGSRILPISRSCPICKTQFYCEPQISVDFHVDRCLKKLRAENKRKAQSILHYVKKIT